MNPALTHTVRMIAIGACVVALLAAMGGTALAMWMDKGPQLYMALIESGLAWCL